MEDSEDRAHFLGKQQLLYPRVKDMNEYFVCVEAVTKEQVNALAKRLLTTDRIRLVVIGKEKDEEKLLELIG
jgi:predicted Zn-dependent peptidase